MNQYDKIMARTDGRKPRTVRELAEYLEAKVNADGLVLSVDILMPNGERYVENWSERKANQDNARDLAASAKPLQADVDAAEAKGEENRKREAAATTGQRKLE